MQASLDIPVGEQNIAACLHTPDVRRLSVAAPVVVCCHGLTGTRVGTCYRFVRLARRLTELNMSCLRFDFRGCGESDGNFQDVNAVRLAEDLKAVIRALDHARACDPTRLGIVASSFGAFTTALCGRVLAALRALVFWAPVAHPQALIDRDMPPDAWEFLRQHGWVPHRGLRMGRSFFDRLPGVDAPALLAERPSPLLVFHGEGDTHVPIEHGRAYAAAMKAAGVEVRLEPIATDDHGMRGVETSDRLVAESAEWMRRFLHPEATPANTS